MGDPLRDIQQYEHHIRVNLLVLTDLQLGCLMRIASIQEINNLLVYNFF